MTIGKQQQGVNDQNQMYQKMQQEKRQMEMALESQRKEMERMQENQQRIIEQQKSENESLKNKNVVQIGSRSNFMTGNPQSEKPKSAPPSQKPSQGVGSSNINSILNKLKQNLPRNDETSSVTEEDTSDRRVLMTSTVDSEKIKNAKGSVRNKKSIINIKK
jgi:hypothetical protein